MYSSPSQGKGNKGSVQFKNTRGRLQIVFSYPIQENGEIKRKRFYISTGYEDTPINRQRVGDTVRTLQRDIDYGEVDLSLAKYQPYAALTTVSSIPPISPNPPAKSQPTLTDLWERYMEFKQQILKDFKAAVTFLQTTNTKLNQELSEIKTQSRQAIKQSAIQSQQQQKQVKQLTESAAILILKHLY